MTEDEPGQSRLRIGRWLPPRPAPRPQQVPEQPEPGAVPSAAGRAPAVRDGDPDLPRHRRPFPMGLVLAVVLIGVVVAASAALAWPRMTRLADRRHASTGAPTSTPPTGQPTPSSPDGSGPPDGGLSPTPGGSPTPGPAGPGPTPVPSASHSSQPVQPTITLTSEDVPDRVDLSAEGTRDWVHWGLDTARSVNRKADGSGAIVDTGPTSVRNRYDVNPDPFMWSDGTPTQTVTETTTGLYTCGQGRGFALTVAAGPTPRTLRLYAGVWMARGRLDVSFPNGGPTRRASLQEEDDTETARFTITFRAPAGSRLTLCWMATQTYATCGGVLLQAATLR